MTHAADQQLTYLRTLDETTRHNAEDIAELARTLRNSISSLSLQFNRVEADLLDTQTIFEREKRYSAAIR